MSTQNYANHARFVPGFHYLLAGLLLVTFIGALINLYQSFEIASGCTALF